MYFGDIIRKNYHQAKRRLTWALYRRQRIVSTDSKAFIEDRAKNGPLKLHLCCGDKHYDNYVNIDIVPLEGTDILMDIPDDLACLHSGSVAEILMESGFEHFYRHQQGKLLSEVHRLLREGGKFIIKNLPDFDAIVDAYIHKKKGNVSKMFDLNEVYRLTHGEPEPHNAPHQLHKDIFTKESIAILLERHGLKVERVENTVFPGETIAVSLMVMAVKPENQRGQIKINSVRPQRKDKT